MCITAMHLDISGCHNFGRCLRGRPYAVGYSGRCTATNPGLTILKQRRESKCFALNSHLHTTVWCQAPQPVYAYLDASSSLKC